MLITVVVTTYNRPKALDRVLGGLAQQSDHHFEVVIADDGSSEETAAIIDYWEKKECFPLYHAWQEHQGFRAGRSRNNAVLQSKGDYLIFLDGDCLPRTNFVGNHRALAEPGFVVAGNRCLLSRTFSRSVEEGLAKPESWNLLQFVMPRLRCDINRLEALVTLPPKAAFRYRNPQRWQRVRSCNMGLFKSDFLLVNGFDASFKGWGFEDSDLAARLINAGIKIKNGTFATAVLHLYHTESRKECKGYNWDRFQEVLAKGHTLPIEGIE